MPHGKICYIEIPANKADDAAAFYSNIFGWKVRQRGDGNLAFDDSGSVSGTWVKPMGSRLIGEWKRVRRQAPAADPRRLGDVVCTINPVVLRQE